MKKKKDRSIGMDTGHFIFLERTPSFMRLDCPTEVHCDGRARRIIGVTIDGMKPFKKKKA